MDVEKRNPLASRILLYRLMVAVIHIALALVVVSPRTLFASSPTTQSNATDQGLTGSLPTGVRLDAAGELIKLGNMPQAFAVAPGSNKVVVVLSGFREQGLQLVDLSAKQVTQTLPQGATFVGVVFSPDGRMLYVSGDDSIYCYSWNSAALTLRDKIQLSEKPPEKMGTRIPAGLGISPDGKYLYVAENVAHTLDVIDLTTSSLVQRHRVGRYPYAVAVSPGGDVYVSAWGEDVVSTFRVKRDGQLEESGRIIVGRHPSALLLNASGSRLYAALASTDQVAIVDTQRRLVLNRLHTSVPGSPPEGSTPNALALSEDGSRLFVAEADSNDVSVFHLSKRSSGRQAGGGSDHLMGRIPTDWYPTGVIAQQGQLLILTGKGLGTGPNPNGPTPDRDDDTFGTNYTLGQTNGTLRFMSSSLTTVQLDSFAQRVRNANGWSKKEDHTRYPQFKHVIFIIKENRTYDQLLGDMPEGDGDPSLLFFGQDTTPNHHALAKRFGLFDRFFVNAEVSSQGHLWSTAAYVTDYVEKVIPAVYADRRGDDDEGDVDMPSTGYLWDLARAKNITFRDYGEWFLQPGATRSKGALDQYIDHDYPPFDMTIPDQRRADAWIAELQKFVSQRAMPQLEILHLPGDHTAAGKPGLCTPRACVADNDLALGRIVEALTHSPFWRDTIIFVVEDDAQSGSDHVDSHRAPFLVISPYNHPGTNHRFINTTDVVAAIEDILRLDRMSQYDYFSRSLSDIFSSKPDLTPYTNTTPSVPIDERNPSAGEAATQSAGLDFSSADRVNEERFNEILWKIVKPGQPTPQIPNQSLIKLLRLTGY